MEGPGSGPAGRCGELVGSGVDDHSDVALGVADAVAVASDAVGRAAPGLVWVQGEVEGLTRSRAGHWYWSLSGGGARLAVCALGRDAAMIARSLAAAQVVLADGLTVRVRGCLGVWAPRGQLQLRASTIDHAVCGRRGLGSPGGAGQVGGGGVGGPPVGAAPACLPAASRRRRPARQRTGGLRGGAGGLAVGVAAPGGVGAVGGQPPPPPRSRRVSAMSAAVAGPM